MSRMRDDPAQCNPKFLSFFSLTCIGAWGRCRIVQVTWINCKLRSYLIGFFMHVSLLRGGRPIRLSSHSSFERILCPMETSLREKWPMRYGTLSQGGVDIL
jgi:hypothetical protein